MFSLTANVGRIGDDMMAAEEKEEAVTVIFGHLVF